MVTVYVFSGGYTAERVLNALAAFFHEGSWASLLFIVSIIALLMTAIRFFMSHDHHHLFNYFVTNIFITAFLLTPTESVQIEDASNPAVRIVSNVPIGVAAPAHFATTLMYGLSQAVDFIFATPDDQNYARTGMLFGSKMVRLTQQVGIQNTELKNLWSQYTQNCIRKDITINHKYTWNDFANATDIFEFLANNHPSPVRRIAMDGAFPTCKEALPRLEKKFIDDANKSISLLSIRAFGDPKAAFNDNQAQLDAMTEAAVGSSYASFYGVNKSATDILKQNIAVNGVRSGLYDGAAKMNATATAFNYARTQSQMQTQSTMVTIGLNAQDWLPIVHSVLVLLLICSSVPTLLSIFIPGMTLKVLKSYVGGLFYLAMWPFFFTVINMIMTYSLQSASMAAVGSTDPVTQPPLLHAMSLSATNPMMAMYMKYAAIAGWLMMAVPVIAKNAFNGGGAMVEGMAYQLMNMSNSNASQAARAAATGDVSYGVVQMDTWQANTANENKFDSSFSNQSFGALTQRADGSSVNYLPGGQAVYSSRAAISTPGFDISSSEVQSRSLQNSLQEAERTTAQTRTSYNQSVGNVSDQLTSLTQTASHNASYSSNTQHGQTSNVQNTLSKMDSVIQDYANSKGISHSEATKEMSDTYFGVGASITGSASAGKKVGIGEGKISGSLGFDTGKKITFSDSETDEHNRGRTERTSNSKQNQFNDLMSQLEQYSSSDSSGEVSGFNQQAVSNLSESIRHTEDLAHAYDASYAKEQSYSAALQDVQSGSLSLSTNLIPEFQDYVAKRNPGNVEAIMNGRTPAINEEREAYFEAFMAEKFEHYNPELKQAFDNSNMDQGATAVHGSDLKAQYAQNSANLEQRAPQGRSEHLDEKIQSEQGQLFNEGKYQEKRTQHKTEVQHNQEDLAAIKKHR
ncbi:TPA: conjugal transfer mating-pair stabilization protein TraG [Photobacterium damselae]